MDTLRDEGAEVVFFDPYIPRFRHHGKEYVGEPELTSELIGGSYLVIGPASHSNVDYNFV